MSDTQYSLTFAFSKKTRLSLTSDKADLVLANFWVTSLLFIFEYAPLISGLGAIGYGIASILSTDVFSILINRNLIVFFNIFAAISGFITVGTWIAQDWFLGILLTFMKLISGTI
jgi:hypothetical protein